MPTQVQAMATRYIDLVFEKIEDSKYPSKDLLDRAERALVIFWEEENSQIRR
jgi:hypothetical protein